MGLESVEVLENIAKEVWEADEISKKMQSTVAPFAKAAHAEKLILCLLRIVKLQNESLDWEGI